jgi:hypothetical protein
MVSKILRIWLPALILIFNSAAFGWNIFPSLGGERSGTSVMTFLKIGVGARAASLAGAYTATATDVFALYHNPAGIAFNDKDNFGFAYRQWVVDFKHSFFGVTRHIDDSNVLGAFLITLGTDSFEITDEYHPLGTGNMFDYSDFAAGLTYAIRLTDYFSFGINFKYAQENLGDLKMRAGLIDLGTLYQTDFYGTRFAINMSNFGGRIKPSGSYRYKTVSGEWIEKNYQSFSSPTVFKISAAFDPLASGDNKLTWMTQLNHPTDNAENIAMGMEYSYQGMFFLRGGYLVNSTAENFSVGAGIKFDINRFDGAFDFAYTDMKELGGTNVFSIVLGF